MRNLGVAVEGLVALVTMWLFSGLIFSNYKILIKYINLVLKCIKCNTLA